MCTEKFSMASIIPGYLDTRQTAMMSIKPLFFRSVLHFKVIVGSGALTAV